MSADVSRSVYGIVFLVSEKAFLFSRIESFFFFFFSENVVG